MKTDVCTISTDQATFQAIFAEVEKSAAYNKLSKKQTLQLRLLAEELVGMLPELLEVGSGQFWIENQGGDFQLHASIQAQELSLWEKKNLLTVSKSGKNAAAKGIVNKIKLIARGMLDGYLEATRLTGGAGGDYYEVFDMGASVTHAYYQWPEAWSLDQYRKSAGDDKSGEAWDELERSIIANLADDVIVGVLGNKVDIIIEKRFQ